MTIDDLIERSDYELFTKACCGSHSLYICSHRIVHVICGCSCVVILFSCLINYYTDLHKKSLIVRSLYEYIK